MEGSKKIRLGIALLVLDCSLKQCKMPLEPLIGKTKRPEYTCMAKKKAFHGTWLIS